MKVTRSFVTTSLKIVGEPDPRILPGKTATEARKSAEAFGLEVESATDYLQRYACSQEEFLSIAKPV